jgi:hypothetical protein
MLKQGLFQKLQQKLISSADPIDETAAGAHRGTGATHQAGDRGEPRLEEGDETHDDDVPTEEQAIAESSEMEGMRRTSAMIST